MGDKMIAPGDGLKTLSRRATLCRKERIPAKWNRFADKDTLQNQ